MLDRKMEAVLITSSKASDNIAASGLSFDQTYVITTGTILIPMWNEKDWICGESSSSPGLRFIDESSPKIKFRIQREVIDERENSRPGIKRIISNEGHLMAFWNCNVLERTLKKIFHNPMAVRDSNGKSLENDFDVLKSIVSTSMFLILKYNENQKTANMEDLPSDEERRNVALALKGLCERLSVPTKGEAIEVVSTPFGNEYFLNSISRGIVSNLLGNDKCLILTDARTVPGCEGGPIYACKNSRFQISENRLVGLVACPLFCWRNQGVGLTIGINLTSVLKEFFFLESAASNLLLELSGQKSDEILMEELGMVDRFVVLVRSGNAWGSGIVLDSNTVITCSHVLKEDENITIFCMKSKYNAFVVYKASNNAAYDLAILRVEHNSFSHKVKFCEESAKAGDEVIAAGYSFFSEEVDFNTLTIARGCIATVHPSMIQSTCCVQSGFSGGALLKKGKLIGVIVCNLKDFISDVFYPRVNFAVPSKVFQSTVTNYLVTKNVDVLKSLEMTDSQFQILWSFKKPKL